MVKMEAMTDDEFNAGGNYFGVGVYEVILQSFERVKPEDGAEYLKVHVLGEEDQEADVRLYMSEKAAKWTRQKLANIAVHNTEGDAKREAVKESFKKIVDTDSLTDKFLSNMKNMQAWLEVAEDLNAPKQNGGFYLRYNLSSWKPKETTTAEQLMAKSEPVDDDDSIPFGDS